MQKIELDQAVFLDGLGRGKFTRHFFDLITNIDARQGAVVGLEGSWGSGKSSVLKGFEPLAEELPEQERPLILQFNPWMVSGTSGLVEALLIQLAKDLATKTEKSDKAQISLQAAERILAYAEVLGAVKYAAPLGEFIFPGSGVVLGGIGYASEAAAKEVGWMKKLITKFRKIQTTHAKKLPSISDSKASVEKALDKTERRIVVILDDIDRLPPIDVASIIQAVKAVANFPNVIYILAYDPLIAAKALKASVQVDDGIAYLEKIIQLAIRLPDIPLARFYSHARQRLASIVPGGQLRSEESADVEAMWPTLFAILRTPRDIERLRTKLQTGIPMLIGEVNLADVILLEALSIIHPSLIQWIHSNGFYLMDLGMAQMDSDWVSKGLSAIDLEEMDGDSSRKARQAEIVGSWKAEIFDPTKHYVVRAALGFLFPQCSPDWARVDRSNFHRIKRYRFWYKWRCYHDHQEPWSVQQIEAYVADPRRIASDGFLKDLNSFRELMQHVCDLNGVGLSEVDSREMVKMFAKASDIFGVDAVADFGHGFGPIAALELCFELDPHHWPEALSESVEVLSLWVTRYLLTKMRRRIKEGELSFDEGALQVIVSTWADKVETQLIKRPWTSPGSDYSPYGLLVGLDRLEETKRALQLAGDFLDDDSERLCELLSNFEDSFINSAFPLDVQWQVLPHEKKLLELAEASENFKSKYSVLYGLIKKRANAIV